MVLGRKREMIWTLPRFGVMVSDLALPTRVLLAAAIRRHVPWLAGADLSPNNYGCLCVGVQPKSQKGCEK